MISGLPEIDIDDLKETTNYVNYVRDSQVITWFWEILTQEYDNQMRASFVQFFSGTSKVPLEGFKALKGMNGTQKFSIHKAYNTNSLPTSHTCFNQLDLPDYPSKDILRQKLTYAGGA